MSEQRTAAPHHSPEQEPGEVPVDIILQRHGEKGADGWLTEAGVAAVKAEASRLAETYLSPDTQPVTFFILYSDSAAYIGDTPAGRRAEQTGQITAETLSEAIAERGLDSQQASIHNFGNSSVGTRAHRNLREPDYYYVDNSSNPTEYFDALVESHGSEGREEAYFAEDPELEQLRQEVGAESSSEVAHRLSNLTDVIGRYSDLYRRQNPGRRLVFVLETHGDVIRSFMQHELDQEGLDGWQPSTSETVVLSLKNGRATVQ